MSDEVGRKTQKHRNTGPLAAQTEAVDAENMP
jgi:hypothetical protein